ncbi:MAG: helix-turn-helix transcriptional regulator [Planctomycetes bacterium]|nr:helix-turn-helix transcriptional regulator [Planctomycetota bacterium]
MTTALTNKPQFIDKNGRHEYAIISYDDFVRAFRPEPTIPHEVITHSVSNGGNLIKAWRKHLGINQKEMAKRMKTTQSAYSQIENGNPSHSTLKKVAKAMKIDVAQLDLDDIE